MSKILSIDFDIIMHPCIKLYNEKVGGDANPTSLWKYLEEAHDIDQFICYDAKTLLALGRILKKATQQHTPIFAITEHQQIVDHLKEQEDYDENRFIVHNIDFHHDIWYRPEDKNAITMFDKYDCSDWLGYLFLQNKIDEIVWIKAANSQPFNDPNYEDPVITRATNIHTYSDEDHQYDAVYFCLSPQWVPYKFQHLYHLLLELTKEEDKAYDEHSNECK